MREPIEGLIRWSTPMMVRGPEGDQFRSDWLLVALPALLGGRTTRRRAVTVRIAVDDDVIQVRMTSSGVEVARQDSRDVDAVLRADAPIVLGLAAGALTLDDVRAQVGIEGDETAVRTVLESRSLDRARG